MTKKILSIITVTKNCVHTIERTLKSVELVKTEHIEYIIVDGVSNDGTFEIIQKYSNIIDQFICEPDKGIYQAMNKGVARSNGEFILFLNGDDEIIPDGVKEILASLSSYKEQIVCATTIVIGDENNPGFSYIPDPKKLVFWDSVPHPSSFIRRELLVQSPFREDLQIASDYDFFLKAFLAGVPFKVIPYQSTFHYYGGASSNINKTKVETDTVIRSHLGWWRAHKNKIISYVWRGLIKISNLFHTKV